MTTDTTPAYDRFRASMEIGYEQWHDGTPYDLEALDEMTAAERQSVEALLVARGGRRWRDIQALARLNTPAARAAIRADLASADADTRLYAAEKLAGMGEAVDMSPFIVSALEQDHTFGGLDRALDIAARFPTDEVRAALLKGAREASDERGIHFAALLHFIHGLTDEEFAWERRPFYLRFGPDDPADRAAAYAELCAELGIVG